MNLEGRKIPEAPRGRKIPEAPVEGHGALPGPVKDQEVPEGPVGHKAPEGHKVQVPVCGLVNVQLYNA